MALRIYLQTRITQSDKCKQCYFGGIHFSCWADQKHILQFALRRCSLVIFHTWSTHNSCMLILCIQKYCKYFQRLFNLHLSKFSTNICEINVPRISQCLQYFFILPSHSTCTYYDNHRRRNQGGWRGRSPPPPPVKNVWGREYTLPPPPLYAWVKTPYFVHL